MQVTALQPCIERLQLDLFAETNIKRQKINKVMDNINAKYGEFVLQPATLLERSAAPNVISFSWKLDGIKNTKLINENIN